MSKRRKSIELHGSIWMTVGNQSLGGSGRIELLTRIAESGSITQAAREMKMSYKAAWDALDSMNNLSEEPLLERFTGGKGGGGTCLTPRGEQLVRNFRIIEQEHKEFISHLDSQSKGMIDDVLLIRRMGMKTSARNQFFGKVTAVKKGAVNDEITVRIAGDQDIIAIITHESAISLSLKKGVEVFSLVKSSSIILALEEGNTKFSARNCLAGTISRIQPGAVNTEVVIELPHGGSIVAIITNESRKNLKLKIGKKVSAIFNAASVILSTAA